ncbi:MAG TPA: TIM barrel protein [Bryobacteraceae bacterium]|jgi:sugar phosphate isomerase/epimerase|nr:TIM barrel protein [Bryobacteraceae bacterium]
MTDDVTRRAALLTGLAFVAAAPQSAAEGNAQPAARNLKVAIFSKHLQFLEGAELARCVAELGFDGIDLTVRAGGHVEPASAATALPPLVSLIREQHLEVPMVTTDIIDADSPNARTVLKTLAGLGIRYYRWGGFQYRDDAPFARQLEDFRKRAAALAALNAEYNVCAIYHTHSGVNLVGAPVWDIFEILKDLDPNAVAINYDVGHATVEGGLGGWIDSFRLSTSHIRGVAIKDFVWQQEANGNWNPQWRPLGQGMVRFPKFFSLLAATSFDGPVQLHFEYPLGGADAGKRQITIDRAQVFSAMRRDLERLRTYLNGSGLAHV